MYRSISFIKPYRGLSKFIRCPKTFTSPKGEEYGYSGIEHATRNVPRPSNNKVSQYDYPNTTQRSYSNRFSPVGVEFQPKNNVQGSNSKIRKCTITIRVLIDINLTKINNKHNQIHRSRNYAPKYSQNGEIKENERNNEQ